MYLANRTAIRVENCRFEGNGTALNSAHYTGIAIADSVICSNGTGISTGWGVTLVVSNTVIASHTGGGLISQDDDAPYPQLMGCRFEGNSSANGAVRGEQASVSECQFARNAAAITLSDGLVLRDSTFISNSGCVRVGGGQVEIAGSTFEKNTGGDGGAVWLFNPKGSIRGCLFSDCRAGGSGGAVYARLADYGAPPSLYFDDCTFLNNAATNSGGAVAVSWGACVFSNCTFAGNRATFGGGGLYLGDHTTSSLYRCTIASNRVTQAPGGSGGGVYIGNTASYSVMVNCDVHGNSADLGGGIFCHGPYTSLHATNCTIAGNLATPGGFVGGGIYANSLEGVHLFRCILWTNFPDEVQNHWTFTAAQCCAPSNVPGAMITANPLFVDLAGGDYHLRGGSPCIDVVAVTNGPPDDRDGVPRGLDGDANGTGLADLGAYEYVHPLADTDGDGLLDGEELVADTDPLNAGSVLSISRIQLFAGMVELDISGGIRARRILEARHDLTLTGEKWEPLWSNEPPTPARTSVTIHAVDVSDPTHFYRIRAERVEQ